MSHFLEVDDLAPDELAHVLELAQLTPAPAVLTGRGVALIFEKPSARTRNSSEMAVFQLGGHPLTIRGEEVGFDRRESVEDVTLTLSQYHAAIGARVFDHKVLERMAAVSPVPVINLLSDLAHPCQGLADLLTLQQHFGRPRGPEGGVGRRRQQRVPQPPAGGLAGGHRLRGRLSGRFRARSGRGRASP